MPEIAVHYLKSKMKNYCKIGIVMPPPPIPATVQSIINIERVTRPTISMVSGGNKDLCSQNWLLSASTLQNVIAGWQTAPPQGSSPLNGWLYLVQKSFGWL